MRDDNTPKDLFRIAIPAPDRQPDAAAGQQLTYTVQRLTLSLATISCFPSEQAWHTQLRGIITRFRDGPHHALIFRAEPGMGATVNSLQGLQNGDKPLLVISPIQRWYWDAVQRNEAQPAPMVLKHLLTSRGEPDLAQIDPAAYCGVVLDMRRLAKRYTKPGATTALIEQSIKRLGGQIKLIVLGH